MKDLRAKFAVIFLGFFLLAGCDDAKLSTAIDTIVRALPTPTETPEIVPTARPSQTPSPTPSAPIPTQTTTPIQPQPQPDCAQEMRASDGADGFLWKPKSDHGGRLVVLFPSRFTTRFNSVEVQRKSEDFESLVFAGFSNGDRQTWRGSASGGKYKDNSIVVGKYDEEICVWRIKKANQRND